MLLNYYDRYNKKINYFFFEISPEHGGSKELVQSVFINVWNTGNSLDETMSVKSYIFRSTVNYIYNYLKRKAFEQSFV